MPPASNPLDVQHGGDHYKRLRYQPVQFGTANAYDPCAFSTMKYVSRHEMKGGALDLDKAMHFVDLRIEMIRRYGQLRRAANVIDVEDYITGNLIPTKEAWILRNLHAWVRGRAAMKDEAAAAAITGQIAELRDLHYH